MEKMREREQARPNAASTYQLRERVTVRRDPLAILGRSFEPLHGGRMSPLLPQVSSCRRSSRIRVLISNSVVSKSRPRHDRTWKTRPWAAPGRRLINSIPPRRVAPHLLPVSNSRWQLRRVSEIERYVLGEPSGLSTEQVKSYAKPRALYVSPVRVLRRSSDALTVSRYRGPTKSPSRVPRNAPSYDASPHDDPLGSSTQCPSRVSSSHPSKPPLRTLRDHDSATWRRSCLVTLPIPLQQ